MNFQILANAAAPEAESAGTISQITETFGIETGPLLVQIVSFGILALVVWYFGFRPLMKTISERQEKIEAGLKFSDEMKIRLGKSEIEYKEKMQKAAVDAAAILESARKSAKETVEKAAQEAIFKTAEIEKRSAENLAREREKMLSELKGEVANLVVETTAKILARDVPAAEKSKIAARAAEEIGE